MSGTNGAQRRFLRFGDAGIAFEALVLKFDVFNGDGVGIGVQIRQGLILRDPATVDLIRNG
jgi:hypothetical protein